MRKTLLLAASAMLVLPAIADAQIRSLNPRDNTRSADASRAEVSARVQTPQVERSGIEPVKSEPAKSESAPELRRSTD